MLIFLLVPLIAISVVIEFVIFNRLNSSLTSMMGENLGEISQKASDILDEWLSGMIREVKAFAKTNAVIDALKSGSWDYLMKEYFPFQLKDKPYIEMAFIAYPDGSAPTTLGNVVNVKDRKYFIEIMQEGKEIVISDALISRATNRPVFVIAAAVKDKEGKTLGVLGLTITLEAISRIAQDVRVGKNGFAWVVDSSGTVLAHPKQELLMKLNIKEASKAGFKGLQEVSRSILGGESGMARITLPDGSVSLIFYSPIQNAKGWAFLVELPEVEITGRVKSITNTLILMLSIMTGVIALIILFVSSSISKPIRGLAQVVASFGEGDLTVSFKASGRDEVAQIAQALERAKENLWELAKAILEGANQISSSVESLAQNAEEISATSEELSAQMEEINKSAQDASASIEEVTASTEEIASSAQNLAKSAQDLTERAGEINKSAKEGEKGLNLIADVINQTKEKARDTEKAVRELAEMAKNIGEIVETISSIAEQTNLLALNAAIEAARAGEAGRGFAVVADEIRKLAEGSKSATSKIAQILGQIQQGTERASLATSETARVIETAMESSTKVRDMLLSILKEIEGMSSQIESLAAIAEEQSASTEEASSAMDMATRSVTTIAERLEEMNKALRKQADSSQGVSAASQELASIAENFLKLVKRFKV